MALDPEKRLSTEEVLQHYREARVQRSAPFTPLVRATLKNELIPPCLEEPVLLATSEGKQQEDWAASTKLVLAAAEARRKFLDSLDQWEE